MKIFMRRAVASVLVMALCLGGIAYQKQMAKASDDEYRTIFHQRISDVKAGTPLTYSVTVPEAGGVEFEILTHKCEFTYEFKDSNGTVLGGGTAKNTDTSWGSGSVDDYIILTNASVGTYSITLTFASNPSSVTILGTLFPGKVWSDAKYTLKPAPAQVPALDSKNLTITAGFKDKLSVINAGGAKLTFTSSNTKVATVDANGNVTAKKKGTSIITVKTSTGYTGTCKVTVKDNVYSTSKLSLSKVPGGSFTVNVYKVSYDKKGNLVIKTRMLNKNGRKAKYLKNFKITVKNEKGKKIGVYSAKKKTLNLKSGKAKAYTFKIKKSKLKIKTKQDLRNMSTPRVSGKYYYNLR